ncbi:MAG: MarR family transcriptional regulator [Bacteroidota bacterium]|nr:MarR family transcriptional regulator [Bacteroidota bacterium]
MNPIDANEIAANLRVVISRLVKILRNETKNDEFLSLTERSTLALVYQYIEILPSELASIEKVTSQSMSQIINKLLKHGFLKKTSSKMDKRKVIITITSSGKKYIEKKRSEKQEWLAHSIFEKTTEKEKQVLINAIKVLTKLVALK